MDSREISVFRNESILDTDYLPDILPHRQNQVKYIADCLESVGKGTRRNIFIFGSPGIGKTASANFVFRQFEDYSGIKTIYINCWNYNTTNAILVKIASELGMFVPRRGWAKDEIMERLLEALQKSKKSLMICLDEVDQLIRKDQKILYDLLSLNEYTKNHTGLIFISNDPHVFADLEPRIISRLNLDEIEFKPYTLEEMKDILKERVEYAFRSVEEGVVALAAVHAINKNGDVRVGLQCLLKAGILANQDKSDKVKTIHIKNILRDVKEVKPEIIKDNINDVEKLILEIVNNNDKMSFDDLYNEYVKSVDSPLTKRMFREYVDHLDSLNLMKFGKRKDGKSRFILKV